MNVYWTDERCVPPDHPDSNQLLGRQALLEKVGAANAVYPMNCDEGPDAYQLRLGEIGKLDVIHLGMGSDGHTAGLFPHSPALQADPGQLVARNEDPSGNDPYPRMTLTFSGIARSRLVIFTVAGERQRPALQAVIDGADLPAARVTGDEVVWLVDPHARAHRQPTKSPRVSWRRCWTPSESRPTGTSSWRSCRRWRGWRRRAPTGWT